MQESRRKFVAAALAAALAAPAAWMVAGDAAAQKAAAAGTARTAKWDELLPKDWDPLKLLRDRGFGQVGEGSERERELMRELREVWDRAPTRSDLDGARLRLPGYVVPLEASDGTVKEFLLVPYFGACIHSPPPPANQIVHVTLRERIELRTMDPIWVSGVVSVARSDSPMGVSGYRMAGERVEPYRDPRRSAAPK